MPPLPNITLAKHYVEKWKPRLNLRDWAVHVELRAVSDQAIAQIVTSCDDHAALIKLPPEFHERSTDNVAWYDTGDGDSADLRLEATIVHELLHLHEYPVKDLFWEKMDEATQALFHKYQEHMIEMNARALIAADRGAWK